MEIPTGTNLPLSSKIIGELSFKDGGIGKIVQRLNDKRNLIEKREVEYSMERQGVACFRIMRLPRKHGEHDKKMLLARLEVTNEKGLIGYVEGQCKEHKTIAPYVRDILERYGLPYENVNGL